MKIKSRKTHSEARGLPCHVLTWFVVTFDKMCFPANNTSEKQHRKVSAALKNQPAKIAMIKEIWATGERNRAEIARKVDVHPDSVERWIASALKTGDLKE